MRNIIAIAKKEMTVYLTTPWAWIVFTFVSFVSSFFFIGLLVQFKQAHEQIRLLDGGWEQVGPEAQFLRNLTDGVVMPLFSTMLVVLMFVIPFLSARLFAEERRQKTFELLMTSPITSAEIVIGKYLGGLVIIGATVSVTMIYPLVLAMFGSSFSATTSEKTATLEWATVLLGFGALVVWGATILSIGTFISSLTSGVARRRCHRYARSSLRCRRHSTSRLPPCSTAASHAAATFGRSASCTTRRSVKPTSSPESYPEYSRHARLA